LCRRTGVADAGRGRPRFRRAQARSQVRFLFPACATAGPVPAEAATASRDVGDPFDRLPSVTDDAARHPHA
jgi:hypothetical protein